MSASHLLKIAWAPVYTLLLPKDHRFPMLKYDLIPGQLLHEGTIEPKNIFSPGICSDDIILQTHTSEYLSKLKDQTLSAKEQRYIGFPQSPALTNRELVITQGTIDCCHYAFENGISMNVAGGTHHAFADHGEGFCLLNDFAVAANYLLDKKYATEILIIDLDVHQGNGTAKIFENQPAVFTFSMHGRHNYPFHKEQSDWDLPLEDGSSDDTYLGLLEGALKILRDKCAPDFVFYLSGVDILATDKFGKLKVSMNGCKRRDEMVFHWLRDLKVPCAVSMGGGYSEDIKIITEAHCNTFRVAKDVYGL